MRRTALSHLLAAVGQTRIIAAALRKSDEIEQRVASQIKANRVFDAETQAVLDLTAVRFAEVRKLARRDAIAAQLDALALSLPDLARQAAAELAETAQRVRSDPAFAIGESELFEVASGDVDRSAA